ncbi:MAG TPA: helix-turn-helix domain-containing protein [Kofleriaceae bacterium]|nr:helix-turn-helix domain-containing protein [Kofleriaceae bacterium]
MNAPDKRGGRRERALATRRRILHAAYALFRERGYAGTTMDAIAQEARVAVQTLYFTFHTKAAILDETIGAAVTGFDSWVPPTSGVATLDIKNPAVLRQYHPWYGEIETTPSARRGLQVFVDAAVDIMERAAPLTTSMHQAASDPDAKAVLETGKQRRYEAYSLAVRMLAKKRPGLRDGLTVKRATDVLFTVFSDELYQMLRERGWKPREVHTFLLDLLTKQLLASR